MILHSFSGGFYIIATETKMTISFRNSQHPADYQRISDFLIANYQPGNQNGNWLEPAWEYMHYHPALQPECLAL